MKTVGLQVGGFVMLRNIVLCNGGKAQIGQTQIGTGKADEQQPAILTGGSFICGQVGGIFCRKRFQNGSARAGRSGRKFVFFLKCKLSVALFWWVMVVGRNTKPIILCFLVFLWQVSRSAHHFWFFGVRHTNQEWFANKKETRANEKERFFWVPPWQSNFFAYISHAIFGTGWPVDKYVRLEMAPVHKYLNGGCWGVNKTIY